MKASPSVKLIIRDGRGLNMKLNSEKNFLRVYAWMQANPSKFAKDCATDLCLDPKTVRKHMKRAVAESMEEV